jgi:hypothetical protein
MKPILGATTALFALAALSAAVAQPGAPPPGPLGVGGPPPYEPPAAPQPAAEAAPEVPVLLITSVEVMRSTHPPELDVIRVHGLTATSGWTNPTLQPLVAGTPPDGILDLLLVAEPPPPGTEPLGFSPIAQVLPLEPGHPYKGFRVHSATNGVTVTALPGFAEVHPTLDDCEKCVGKYFVATGAAMPAGKTAADVVKQESLPATLRIVRPSDGIPMLMHNPNRLTLVLNEAGLIVDAAWD